MEVRSMEDKTMAATQHDHSSNKECEDSVKPLHGIANTYLTLFYKNSRKRNGIKRQEVTEAA
jgi:hypothetical protein